MITFAQEDTCRLWTIQDAKDGDVLATENGRPFIIRCMVESEDDIPSAYCGINARLNKAFITTEYNRGTSKWTNSKVYPATKEQRDLFFQKMKEAGYKWDADKKELKKIEQKPIEWSKQQVVNTLTSMLTEKIKPLHTKWSDKTITDRELMFMDALIEIKSFVNSPSFQIGKDVPKDWTEEDEKHLFGCIAYFSGITESSPYYNDFLWLKSLKEKVQPQPKQEWSEEDEKKLNRAIHIFEDNLENFENTGINDEIDESLISWIKSLKEKLKGE